MARETPLVAAQTLSQRLGNACCSSVKIEQPVFSFKVRGAYNKIGQLTTARMLARGVITAFGRQPRPGGRPGGRAPRLPRRDRHAGYNPADQDRGRQTTRRHRDSAWRLLQRSPKSRPRLEATHGYTFIHPYDDPEVIAGQGTIGMELLRQHTRPHPCHLHPVGGGGLAAGIPPPMSSGYAPKSASSAWSRSTPTAMSRSLKARRRITLPQVGLFADGVAVKRVGGETFRLCRNLLDEIISSFNTDDIAPPSKTVSKLPAPFFEPAGALAIAGSRPMWHVALFVMRRLIAGSPAGPT